MATEAEIRGAERARLEAVVAEHGTEHERFELAFSGLMRAGFTLAQWEGLEPIGYHPPEPEVLARLARRVERRVRFGLPAVECGGDPPTHGCSCLERALDGSDGGKRGVLKSAAEFHWAPPPRRERAEPVPELAATPREAVAAPQEANGRVEAGIPTRVRDRDITASEPVFRPVRRRPKWFDPHPGSFRDMQF